MGVGTGGGGAVIAVLLGAMVACGRTARDSEPTPAPKPEAGNVRDDARSASDAPVRDAGFPDNIRVLTFNLYVGVHVRSLLSARSLDSLRDRVDQAYQQLRATDFGARAAALARLIAQSPPDVLCLQEVALYRRETSGSPGFSWNPNAKTVLVDFLTLVQAALRKERLHYSVAVVGSNEDVELPSRSHGNLRFTNRNAILIRSGIDVVAHSTHLFTVQRHVERAGMTLAFRRGWVMAKLRKAGLTFVVANPHLSGHSTIKTAQAAELLTHLASERRPLIVAGDFNQNPTTSPVLAAAMARTGLMDVWPTVGRGHGFTCCNRKTLDNGRVRMTGRLDLVLIRGLRARRAALAGVTPTSRAHSGRRRLWISDHAGLQVELAPSR